MRYFRITASGLRRGVCCLALLAGSTATPAQEIYKSVDAQGNVVYSDRAQSKNAPTTAVHVTEPDPAEVARLAKQQQLLNASDREREKQAATDSKNRAALEHKQQVNCENARNKYFRYKDSGRIYQRDADGNRVFYTDADADALREQARRSMLAACGS
jgi:tRNA A37 threonylcarbamoyladenosine modification protein TsaB